MDKKFRILVVIGLCVLALSTIGALIYGYSTAGQRKQIANEKAMVKKLPYETDEFLIEHTGEVPEGEYTITLYAILNGDSQLTRYNRDLKDYKRNALSWIKSQEVDNIKIKINWLPEEAKNI